MQDDTMEGKGRAKQDARAEQFFRVAFFCKVAVFALGFSIPINLIEH